MLMVDFFYVRCFGLGISWLVFMMVSLVRLLKFVSKF